MKKTLDLSVIICLLIFTMISTIIFPINVNADVNKVGIYVNGVKILEQDISLISDNEIFIPLRAVLEALGSEVTWEESTGNVYFTHENIDYVCKFVALNPYFPQNKDMLVCRIENIDSKKNSDYIQLHPMCASGTCCMLNDRTFLNQDTGKRLFEALGCSVEIDLNAHIVNISTKH